MGCGFAIETVSGEAVALEYLPEDSVGNGALCSKGNYILDLVNHPDRLIEPSLDGKPASWNTALKTIADRISTKKKRSVAGIIMEGDASGEDIAVFQLFAEQIADRGCAAISCLTGDDRMLRTLASLPFSIPRADPADVEKSDCILAIGDPFDVAPVIAGRCLNAKYARKGTCLGVISTKSNRTSPFATIPVTGPTRKTLAELLVAVADLKKDDSAPWLSAARNSIPSPDNPRIVDLAGRLVKSASPVIALETADPRVAQLAGAVCMAVGSGARLLPVYSYGNAGLFAASFATDVTVESIWKSIESGRIKTLIVLGGDPVRDYPEKGISELLRKLDFLAIGSPFANETTPRAHVVLPTALWLETGGTYFNSLLPPAVEPPGLALSYGEIVRRLISLTGASYPSGEKEQSVVSEISDGGWIFDILKRIDEPLPLPSVYSTATRHANGTLTGRAAYSRIMEMKA